jgi:hypothetical protein
MKKYWNFMASHIGNLVNVIQIYNEAQNYHYRFYTTVKKGDLASYWAGMSEMFGIASNIFKNKNPHIKITTNSSGFPVNDETESDWDNYFDAVGKNLDILSLDLYPGGPGNHFRERINRTEARYKKPIFISETGRQGMDSSIAPNRTIQQQGEIMPKTLDSMRTSKASVILYYELRDSGPDNTNFEQNFGILEYDGTPKASFDSVMAAMQPRHVGKWR